MIAAGVEGSVTVQVKGRSIAANRLGFTQRAVGRIPQLSQRDGRLRGWELKANGQRRVDPIRQCPRSKPGTYRLREGERLSWVDIRCKNVELSAPDATGHLAEARFAGERLGRRRRRGTLTGVAELVR